jgi:XisI protein
MEITQIQTHIKQVLTDLAGNTAPETQLVFDETRGHFLYLRCNWDQMTRQYDVYVHIDILDDLVWVQRDRTDYGVVDELVRLGIPKDKIVLGFQAPYKRKYSGFATVNEVLTH